MSLNIENIKINSLIKAKGSKQIVKVINIDISGKIKTSPTINKTITTNEEGEKLAIPFEVEADKSIKFIRGSFSEIDFIEIKQK